MTELLQRVLDEVSKLPAKEQDALAALILEELASEQRWDRAFSHSADVLAQLSDGALAQHSKGETEQLDPDSL